MAKIKKLRKRDILVFVAAIVAVALVVFGASEIIERASKRTKRDTRPIESDATTVAPADGPDVTTADTDAEPIAATTTPPASEAETSETPSETTPADTSAPDANTPASTTVGTTAKAQELTMPADTGKPADAKSEDEVKAEREELPDDYATNGYNNNIKNIVLLGVDRREIFESDYFRSGGQSDAIMILSMNLKTKEYWIVSINRDIAVPVENYSIIGESYGFVDEQICLAYAYGDGSRLSGRNTIKSLNFLLSDSLPFLGFIAAPMSLVGTLADAVDGVPVDIVDDFGDIDETFVKGTTVVLRGEHAEKYIRARKYMADDPYNAARMTRQFAFGESFINKVKTTMTANQFINLYEDVMSTLVSDMGKADITKWILTAYDYEFKGFYRIDGHRREGELKHNAPFNDIDLKEVQTILDMYFK